VAELEAHAPFFSSSRLPANHFTGRYQMALDAGAALGTPVSGAGFLTCTVSSSGKVGVAGKLPDGTALSTAVNLTQDGELLLHFPLYQGKGLLQGIPQIDDSDLSAQKPRPVSGPNFLWQRPADSSYPSGINQTLSVDGSQYLPTATNLPPFGGTANNSVTFRVEGGFISPGFAELQFDLKGVGVVFLTSLNSGAISLSVNRATGTFSGSYLPPVPLKAVPVQGVLISRSFGYGYALVKVSGTVRPTRIELEVTTP
jgi:hypothetical protein